MAVWANNWGQSRMSSAESESFRISKVKTMDGAINAEMFGHVDLKKERPKRPIVSVDANGDELLKTVVDYDFMMGFNKPGSEAVSVMTRCGFIPLGIAADGADGNVDTLYVLINEQNAALAATPYMSTDIYRNMTAVLAEKVSRAISVKLVRVESSVVNRVIDFIYYRIEITDNGLEDGESVKPLSVDVQPGETGVIMQARAWSLCCGAKKPS